MSKLALTRLCGERKSWRKSHPHSFIAKPSKNPDGSTNLFYWNCGIPGKHGSPWEGGVYPLNIYFTDDYPHKPPKCQFQEALFHPNIYRSGDVCLSILNEDNWSYHYNVEKILLDIQHLLANPDIHDPAQKEPYDLYRKNRNKYWETVRLGARQYQYDSYWNQPKHIKLQSDILNATQLTKKAIIRIVNNNRSKIKKFQPRLQILKVTKHKHSTLKEAFYLVLSDGDYYMLGMVSTECNYLINKKQLNTHCIIHLYQYYVEGVADDNKMCIIKRWKVLKQTNGIIKTPKAAINYHSDKWLNTSLYITFRHCEHLEKCQVIRNIPVTAAMKYAQLRRDGINYKRKKIDKFNQELEVAILSDFIHRNNRNNARNIDYFMKCKTLYDAFRNKPSQAITSIVFCLFYGDYLLRNKDKKCIPYYHEACKLGVVYQRELYNNARGRLISVYMMLGKYNKAIQESKSIDPRHDIPHIAAVYIDLLVLYAALENKSKMKRILNLMEENVKIIHEEIVVYWIGKMRLCLIDKDYKEIIKIYLETTEYEIEDTMELELLYNYALSKSGSKLSDINWDFFNYSGQPRKTQHYLSMLYSRSLYFGEYIRTISLIDRKWMFPVLEYPHYFAFGMFDFGKLFFESSRYILAKQLIFKACKTTPELPIIIKYGDEWKRRVIEKVRDLKCSFCGQSNVKLKACSGCCQTQYCSKFCQKKAWKLVHRTQCINNMGKFVRDRKNDMLPTLNHIFTNH